MINANFKDLRKKKNNNGRQHRLTANAGFRSFSSVSARMCAQMLADTDASTQSRTGSSRKRLGGIIRTTKSCCKFDSFRVLLIYKNV